MKCPIKQFQHYSLKFFFWGFYLVILSQIYSSPLKYISSFVKAFVMKLIFYIGIMLIKV